MDEWSLERTLKPPIDDAVGGNRALLASLFASHPVAIPVQVVRIARLADVDRRRTVSARICTFRIIGRALLRFIHGRWLGKECRGRWTVSWHFRWSGRRHGCIISRTEKRLRFNRRQSCRFIDAAASGRKGRNRDYDVAADLAI